MKIDMVGERFGRWVVLSLSTEPWSRSDFRWLCRCDCGTQKLVSGYVLRSGKSKSCGCLRSEMGVELGKASKRHGEGGNGKESPEYRCWTNMLSRCRNEKHRLFHNYGGRGITVNERWFKFENFLVDMGRKPGVDYSLDRIDNNGPYSKDNCRWATDVEQNNNQRPRKPTKFVTIDGITKSLKDWLKETGVSIAAYYQRIHRGMSEEAAIRTPMQNQVSVIKAQD